MEINEPLINLPNSVADSAASTSSEALPYAEKYLIPVGLDNLHNSCYLNSVLQCLKYTPPFAVYCLDWMHTTPCGRNRGECTFCILEYTICSLFFSMNRVEAPKMLYERLMAHPMYFQRGRQEDVHELLHFLIEDCGNGFESREKSVLENIFGGVMQRDIKCRSCGQVSTSSEDMLGLSLDINELSTVSEAFASFFRPEVLDEDNQYKCNGCQSLCDADMRMSIRQPPQVLTIQLKRFDPMSGRKLNHYIEIEGHLSLDDHMIALRDGSNELEPAKYELYGVIVHRGSSLLYGHYYAYVKEPRGQWHRCDDERVLEVNEEQVLASNAYLLFYERL